MADNNRTHTLHIGVDDAINISGVLAVDSITDKEAVLHCDCGRVVVKGIGLVLHQLDSDKGQTVLHCTSISSVQYTQSKKLSIKSLFGA